MTKRAGKALLILTIKQLPFFLSFHKWLWRKTQIDLDLFELNWVCANLCYHCHVCWDGSSYLESTIWCQDCVSPDRVLSLSHLVGQLTISSEVLPYPLKCSIPLIKRFLLHQIQLMSDCSSCTRRPLQSVTCVWRRESWGRGAGDTTTARSWLPTLLESLCRGRIGKLCWFCCSSNTFEWFGLLCSVC